ncbi:MAG TPA: hypothetical protein PKW55_02755 [Spirochaetota bacterium]|nr:hypothetical protein [Spirochaetota bacterium]HOM38231.1 hypothetical protein [Spirochaetota bacterium]HPQ48551.1 hypothetical protein [Spirochaetota bacterium]
MEIHLKNDYNDFTIKPQESNYIISVKPLNRELIEKHIEKLNEVVKNLLLLITPRGNLKMTQEEKKGLLIDIKQ